MAVSAQSPAILSDLREFFLETLAPRLATLESFLSDGSDEAEARRVAHGLRGSGATYGFPEVSRLAALAEDAPGDALEERTRRLVEELRDLVEAGSAARVPVLLIEADDAHAERLTAALDSPTRVVERASSAAQAKRMLRESRYGLIVLDSTVSDLDVRTELMQLAERFRTADVPVIVISVGNDPALQADCLQLGAAHVFAATTDARVLAAAATASIERAEQTRRLSALDPVTALPNRAALHETLARWISIGGRSQDPLSLGLIEIDGLAEIHRTRGHLAADELLCHVGERLREGTRKSDYVARWGGSEFIVLFYGATASGATLALQRIESQLESPVSFSAGVTAVDTAGGPEETIVEAYRLLERT